MSEVKNSLILEISQLFFLFSFFFLISGCCIGYCEQFCDWWIWFKGLSMIDCFNCLITLLITLCRVISEKIKQLMH